ncbi:MAG: class I SAM-dependent methyltransferase [Eubacterium sp.]|nr:class I SAM-dependent methyltransferase [Eubacterium sp.]
MEKEKLGNVLLYISKGEKGAEQATGRKNADDRLLEEIVCGCEEEDYHSRITAEKSWTAMYQLAESRANLIEWLRLPKQAKVLELGAGCGTLTSALLKKGAAVTCQEENQHYARLNAKRHRQAREGQLTIYAAPFAQCAPYLDGSYDVAVLADVPIVEGEAEKLLCQVRQLLKPDGLLVLPAKNKFGLKYWAGNKEPYTKNYFAGLETAGVRLYSKNKLQKLLEESGFEQQDFYYPYPDERFALDIYSDRYLPQKGDLTYNITNYEDDRILLFQEQKVFDSIIEEGQFPFFSNAFLCLAWAGSKQEDTKQEAVYVRYASDRSREHAVCTEMTGHSVRKRAMYAQGAMHVAHILEAYKRLTDQYRNTDLYFNRCEERRDQDGAVYAEFERLHARALQEQIEQAAAAEDFKKIFDILRRIVQYIREGSRTVPFAVTEGFTEVFGKPEGLAALRQAVCSEVSDIDLILPNILEGRDGAWHVIDYEWTFFFPVPHNFIIYRTLFFLHHENPQREELSMERLLQETGIPAAEAKVYAQMEEAFQRYVTGGLVPYREMVNLLERRFFNIVELKADYDRVVAQNALLKGQGIWKAARKIKKKLTGN